MDGSEVLGFEFYLSYVLEDGRLRPDTKAKAKANADFHAGGSGQHVS